MTYVDRLMTAFGARAVGRVIDYWLCLDVEVLQFLGINSGFCCTRCRVNIGE